MLMFDPDYFSFVVIYGEDVTLALLSYIVKMFDPDYFSFVVIYVDV